MKGIITLLLIFGVLVTSGLMGAGTVYYIPNDIKRSMKRAVLRAGATPDYKAAPREAPSTSSSFFTSGASDVAGPAQLDLGKFVTNVQSSSLRPILMELSLSIGMKDQAAKEAAKKVQWHIRSDINIRLSSLKLEQISKKSGPKLVQEIIWEILNKRLPAGDVKSVEILKMKRG